MSEFWKHQNLDGSGLQSINQRYIRLKRKTRTAHLMLALFPLGAHQFYLKKTKRGLLYLALSLVASIVFFISPLAAAFLFLAELVPLFIDAKNTERDVSNFNKKLKMTLSLQSNIAMPKNFKGRYHDDSPIDDYLSIKDKEVTVFETKRNPTSTNSRVFSFDEQEKLLKEMNKEKTKK